MLPVAWLYELIRWGKNLIQTSHILSPIFGGAQNLIQTSYISQKFPHQMVLLFMCILLSVTVQLQAIKTARFFG